MRHVLPPPPPRRASHIRPWHAPLHSSTPRTRTPLQGIAPGSIIGGGRYLDERVYIACCTANLTPFQLKFQPKKSPPSQASCLDEEGAAGRSTCRAHHRRPGLIAGCDGYVGVRAVSVLCCCAGDKVAKRDPAIWEYMGGPS